MAETQNKYSRRTVALLGLFVVVVVVGSLIYYEQIALLYVAATLAIVALLVVVGAADLEKVGVENNATFGDR